MKIFSALLALCEGAVTPSLICAWTNGWVNNRYAGDLRRHHTHYDVIVMVRLLVISYHSPRPYHWILCAEKLSFRGHFTNDFFGLIQIRWKFHSAPIQVILKWSLWNFAHGTTVQLSWLLHNYVALLYPGMELHLFQFSIGLKLRWKTRSWNGPLAHICTKLSNAEHLCCLSCRAKQLKITEMNAPFNIFCATCFKHANTFHHVLTYRVSNGFKMLHLKYVLF